MCLLIKHKYQLISNLALMMQNVHSCIYFNPEPDALTTQTNAFLFLHQREVQDILKQN